MKLVWRARALADLEAIRPYRGKLVRTKHTNGTKAVMKSDRGEATIWGSRGGAEARREP